MKNNSKVTFKETDLFRVYQSVDLVSKPNVPPPLFLDYQHLHRSHLTSCDQPLSLQGNLQDGSELADKMPALVKLKSAIYSPEYRAFIECITGLEPGTLTDEVRCTPPFYGCFSCAFRH